MGAQNDPMEEVLGAGERPQFPALYAIRFTGCITPRLEVAFEGMSLSRQDDLNVLSGEVVDQAHLQGIIQQLGILGLGLVDVRRRGFAGL